MNANETQLEKMETTRFAITKSKEVDSKK